MHLRHSLQMQQPRGFSLCAARAYAVSGLVSFESSEGPQMLAEGFQRRVLASGMAGMRVSPSALHPYTAGPASALS